MASERTSQYTVTPKSKWVYSLMILLVIEEIIQHIFVILAFYFNWADIASTVAVSPTILMILGAIVAILFALCLWGMIKKQPCHGSGFVRHHRRICSAGRCLYHH